MRPFLEYFGADSLRVLGAATQDSRRILMEFVRTGLLQAVLASVWLAVILRIALQTGQKVIHLSGGLGAAAVAMEETAFFAMGTGIIVLALGVLLLGIAGFVSTVSITLLLCFLFLGSFFLIKTKPSPLGFEKNGWRLAIMIAPVFFLAWTQCLTPPIESDALAYHLAYPRDFILKGRIDYLPYSFASLWPLQTEMLFTLGLLLQGTALAKLFHWAFYVLTATAIYIFGKRYTSSRSAALGAAVFIFTPAIFTQSSQAYVDLALAFFTFLSVQLFLVQHKSESRAAWWSGVFMGGALATKYLALGFAGILFIFWGIRSKNKLKACALFFLGSFLTAGIWYLRSWWILGNPLYPFFPSFFGGNGYEMNIRDGLGYGPAAFLKLLWNMTLHPKPFGGEILGPLYLMFLPPLIFKIKQSTAPARWMAAFTFFGILFLFTQSQQIRYILALLPFLALGCGVALNALWDQKRLAGVAIRVLFVLVIIIHSALFLYRTRDSWGVITGLQSTEDYLREHERSFKGYEYLKQNLKPGERVLVSGERRYFYDQGTLPIIVMPAERQALEKADDSFEAYLKRECFALVWVEESSGVEPFLAKELEKNYTRVFMYSFTEKPKKFSYSIYRRKN